MSRLCRNADGKPIMVRLYHKNRVPAKPTSTRPVPASRGDARRTCKQKQKTKATACIADSRDAGNSIVVVFPKNPQIARFRGFGGLTGVAAL